MSDWQPRPWDQQGQPSPGQAQPGPPQPGPARPAAPGGWDQHQSAAHQPSPAPGAPVPPRSSAPQPPSGGSPRGGLSSALVGAVVGLVVGAVGFFGLAPADGATGSGSGGSGVTVTTTGAAGGTEGESAAAGQAATPEEQAIYDLAALYNDQDCAGIIAETDRMFWLLAFGELEDNEESVAQAACEDYFASHDEAVEVHQTWIIGATQAVGLEATDVAAMGIGWEYNKFTVGQVDGAWVVQLAGFDHNLNEQGSAAESEEEERLRRPSGRDLAPPTDPPTGNDAFDEIAQNCADGLMIACDDLYWVAPRGSDYELYGITCGGRRIGTYAGGTCEADFGRQVEDEEPATDEGEGEEGESDGEGEGDDGGGEGEGDGSEPSPADGLTPEEVVDAWIAAGNDQDCEAQQALWTERSRRGQPLEEMVQLCEDTLAQSGGESAAMFAGLRVVDVVEDGDVATAELISEESGLMMRVTLAREGDVWLIDFME